MATKTATVLIRLDFYVYIFPLSLLKAHLVLISVVKIINCSRLFDHIFQQLEVPREFIKDHIIIGTTWYVRKKIWRNLEEIYGMTAMISHVLSSYLEGIQNYPVTNHIFNSRPSVWKCVQLGLWLLLRIQELNGIKLSIPKLQLCLFFHIIHGYKS